MATTTAPHIPEDIVLGNILHRFPVKSLLRFSCVCKLWYNKINHDPDFLNTHSLQSQKNPRLIFMFESPIPTLSPIVPDIVLFHILSRLPIKSLRRFSCVSKSWLELIKDEDFMDAHKLTQSQSIITNPESILEKLDSLLSSFTTSTSHFFNLEKDTRSSVGGYLHKIATSESKYKIGECNGLVCFMEEDGKIIEICNPSRREIFTITSQTLLYPDGFSITSSYGFGYDSIKEEYKVVCIVAFVGDFDVDYKCLVFILGTNSWREINIPSPQVSNLLSRMHMSSIFCNGALFWRTSPETELVMFDLHDEKFQVIQFPERFDSSTSFYRQLELNGYLCFARCENEDSIGSKNNYKDVHLYILKDKTESIWMKESFLLPFKSESIWMKESFLLPFVTRRCDLIMDLSGQVSMYWSDGERVQFYNLRTKERRIIQPPGGLHHTYCGVTREVGNFLSLKTFMREGSHGTFCIADYYPH